MISFDLRFETMAPPLRGASAKENVLKYAAEGLTLNVREPVAPAPDNASSQISSDGTDVYCQRSVMLPGAEIVRFAPVYSSATQISSLSPPVVVMLGACGLAVAGWSVFAL